MVDTALQVVAGDADEKSMKTLPFCCTLSRVVRAIRVPAVALVGAVAFMDVMHPFFHQFEGGAADAAIDYINAQVSQLFVSANPAPVATTRSDA